VKRSPARRPAGSNRSKSRSKSRAKLRPKSSSESGRKPDRNRKEHTILTGEPSSRADDADTSWWTLTRGAGPIVATAIHDGSGLRAETRAAIKLSPAERLREEDPHTGDIIAAVPTRVVAHRSRFEVDLNRPRTEAVYRTPEQAWGLAVWQRPPDDAFVERSLRLHDRFYDSMRSLLEGIERDHGAFILLDVHSYNHRRAGPGAPATPVSKAPDINIGTFSMPPNRWTHVLDALIDGIGTSDFRGRRLEVGVDVAFQGRGALTRFVHDNFPQTGCAIALEVKKFFMDEWTGVPYREDIAALQQLIARLLPLLTAALART
jgi:hypothetical protein